MPVFTADFSFTEQLLLNLAGPLLATVGVGFFATWITRKAQVRREDRLREAQELREDHALRERLIEGVTEAPSALYLATQHYSRAQDYVNDPGLKKIFRDALDAQYLESRRKGTVIQELLRLHFPDPEPCVLMHQVMDLLTVRYFQLVTEGGASEGLRGVNAPHDGERHSGLSKDELACPKEVLRKYHETLKELVRAVVHGELEINPRARPPRITASPPAS